MKRSELNEILRQAKAFLDEQNFKLPRWAHWGPEQWAAAGHEWDEIRDNMLGWDITDFGLGRYDEVGLLLFTIRNGNAAMDKYIKPYCEKLLICGDRQVCPTHFHFDKIEDIICRGGGVLALQVWNGAEDGTRLDTPLTVNVDGHVYEVPGGSEVRLEPGESITLTQYMYHAFWGEPETPGGLVLVGEVSAVNDDNTDNRFHDDGIGRFPKIEDDEPPLHLLCNEYPPAP